MCVEHVGFHEVWMTRNGSTVATLRQKLPKDAPRSKKRVAIVVASPGGAFPIGSRVLLQNEMGHVLCGGSHDNSCELHPLDAVERLYKHPLCSIKAEAFTSAVIAVRQAANHPRIAKQPAVSVEDALRAK